MLAEPPPLCICRFGGPASADCSIDGPDSCKGAGNDVSEVYHDISPGLSRGVVDIQSPGRIARGAYFKSLRAEYQASAVLIDFFHAREWTEDDNGMLQSPSYGRGVAAGGGRHRIPVCRCPGPRAPTPRTAVAGATPAISEIVQGGAPWARARDCTRGILRRVDAVRGPPLAAAIWQGLLLAKKVCSSGCRA